MLGLDGEYSAGGSLVFIQNGHDIYTPTDTNSCPAGFKLFAPKSKADWQTVLDSIAANQGDLSTPLSGSNNGQATNLAQCTGECDADSQCAAGLECFQRELGESIPGCSANGEPAYWDYCYDPTFNNLSIDGLIDPYWIADITKPSDGCSGCTNHAMNSGVSEHSAWRTTDNQEWWLRDTPYSQPDGDYKANCYLRMDWRPWYGTSENHSPTAVDNIMFNDASSNQCKHHSESYLCQPEVPQSPPEEPVIQIYSGAGCTGNPIEVSLTNDDEPRCSQSTMQAAFGLPAHHCFDLCNKPYPDGGPSNANQNTQSIYVPEGYVVEAYRRCHGQYNYGSLGFWKTLEPGCNAWSNTGAHLKMWGGIDSRQDSVPWCNGNGQCCQCKLVQTSRSTTLSQAIRCVQWLKL